MSLAKGTIVFLVHGFIGTCIWNQINQTILHSHSEFCKSNNMDNFRNVSYLFVKSVKCINWTSKEQWQVKHIWKKVSNRKSLLKRRRFFHWSFPVFVILLREKTTWNILVKKLLVAVGYMKIHDVSYGWNTSSIVKNRHRTLSWTENYEEREEYLTSVEFWFS